MNDQTLAPGTIVGAERWPYHHAHPDAWGRPWAGELLAQDDPRAWQGSIAFSARRPGRDAVRRHVAWCRANSEGFDDRVPVLWDFGGEKKVYWTDRADVRPYTDDLSAWQEARAAAYAADEARHTPTIRLHVA
jgi:hypothetical protein